MIIVADSSPVISLTIINKLDILNKLFDDYCIPEEVYNEIIEFNKPYSETLKSFFKSKVKKVENSIAVKVLIVEVDKGEAEAIVLALEQGITTILIDDFKGRRTAIHNGLNVLGTLGLLLQAKKKGFINSIKNDIDILIANGFRINKKIYDKILILAEEQ
ncbi:MAG: DUF3368 domain-containing protein [Spirochaetales bacterium]|nr:DUF3368 domain-containing protein [Spirochaetales bacterium]